jgi:hypothetical protein
MEEKMEILPDDPSILMCDSDPKFTSLDDLTRFYDDLLHVKICADWIAERVEFIKKKLGYAYIRPRMHLTNGLTNVLESNSSTIEDLNDILTLIDKEGKFTLKKINEIQPLSPRLTTTEEYYGKEEDDYDYGGVWKVEFPELGEKKTSYADAEFETDQI